MRSFVIAFALAMCGAANAVVAEERVVVVPRDKTEFTVEQSEFVRLTVDGIGGSEFEIKIEGPAKLVSKNVLIEKVKGHTQIGQSFTEFELKPTGTGKVTATISVKSPVPGEKAKLSKYVFDVN